MKMESNQPRENLTDQIIKCCDCGAGFILTSGECQFYLDRGLNLPKSSPRAEKPGGKGGGNDEHRCPHS